jgi:hypothetical protein
MSRETTTTSGEQCSRNQHEPHDWCRKSATTADQNRASRTVGDKPESPQRELKGR